MADSASAPCGPPPGQHLISRCEAVLSICGGTRINGGARPIIFELFCPPTSSPHHWGLSPSQMLTLTPDHLFTVVGVGQLDLG